MALSAQELPDDRATGRAGHIRARAYCGDAHHHEWTVCGEVLPEHVELPVATGTQRYRWVRHPRTGMAARDTEGAFVFVPASER
jgi:hypothetical protein